MNKTSSGKSNQRSSTTKSPVPARKPNPKAIAGTAKASSLKFKGGVT